MTRHGGLDVVESFDSFLIVFHTLRLVCVILVNVMTSSHLFHSVNQFVSRFYGSASKGLLLYASYRLFDWSV